MHLVSIYSLENQIIDEINALISAAGIDIRTNKSLPMGYERIITATALSLVQHAKKANVEPMTLFDIEKLPLIIEDYENGVIQLNGYYEKVDLLTKYEDFAHLSEEAINYRGIYQAHPIQKLLDSSQNISALSIDEHAGACLSKIKEKGINVDVDELYEIFKSGKFMVPAIVDETDSRLMLSYNSYSGDFSTKDYNAFLDFKRDFPNLLNYFKSGIVSKVNRMLGQGGSVPLNGKILINIDRDIKNNHLSLSYYVPITLPNNKLVIVDRHYLSFYSSMTIPLSDLEEFEKTGTNKIVIQSAEAIAADIDTRLKSNISVAKRRLKTKEALGGKSISIDKVAQEMIMLIANEDPEWAREVVLGKRNHYNFKQPQEYAWKKDGKKTTARVGFSSKDGHISATFKMSENQYWRQNTLIVPKIPEIYANSAIGLPARDLVGHPIAEYLGPVKRITTIRELSRITFKNECEAIPHEEFLKKIPEKS